MGATSPRPLLSGATLTRRFHGPRRRVPLMAARRHSHHATQGGDGDASPAQPGARIMNTFRLRLSHPPLDLYRMLSASGALDAYDGAGSGSLIVNVLESLPEATVLHVKPTRPLTFAEVAEE